MRITVLLVAATILGIFLRQMPLDYVWLYDLIGQLILVAIILIFWRWSPLPRKISLLALGFFVGWLADWLVHTIRIQPDDLVALKAGFLLLGVRCVFGFVFLLTFHFAFGHRRDRAA